MRSATLIAIRAFSFACAAIVLLAFPRVAMSFGVVPQHPLDLRSRPDVTAVSFEQGRWLPARGLVVARVIRNIPAGTQICYRSANGAVTCGDVRNAAEPFVHTLSRVVTAVLALAFVLAGAALAITGIDRRALTAAGMLAGAGFLLGNNFLEPNLLQIRDLAVQQRWIAAWEWFPRYAGLLFMLLFATEFPARLPRTRVQRAFLAAFTTLVVLESLFDGIANTPGLLDGTSLATQSTIVSLIVTNRRLLYAGAAVGVLIFALQQRNHAATRAPQLRRSGGLVATALLIGFAPPLTLGILQVATHAIPPSLTRASFLTMLAIPAAVLYAVMAKRVDSVRVLARRALLFTIADRMFPLVRIAPLIAIALLLWMHRRQSIAELAAAPRLALMVLTAIAVVLFAWGELLRRMLHSLFFRDDAAARTRLANLAASVSQCESIDALRHQLTTEIDSAFHPEAIVLAIHDEEEGRLVSPQAPPLSASSPIVTTPMAERRCVVTSELEPQTLPETDRHWLAETAAELLVPLHTSDRLVGLLSLGAKRNELPYYDADAAALLSVASSAALVIENSRLRTRSGGLTVVSQRRADDEIALSCPACGRFFSSAVASRCPADETELQVAEVPFVLSGKYRFERRIGSGGMGVVYRARDLSLERDVAIKTLPRLSRDTAARLRQEARTTANLLHPNLATVFAVETWRGTPMLILEYLDDGTLAERVSRGVLPFESITRCAGSIADALGHVHRRAILHRDVKPSNIGFSSSADAKLLDFGLARLLEDPAMQRELQSGTADTEIGPDQLTITNGVVGTPAYLSPEAVLGQPPHPDFDLWSLSVTVYEAVTGRNPFLARNITGTMNAILAKSVPQARELRPDCPQRLSDFLNESLQRERARRPRSAEEFSERLRAAVSR